MIEAKHYAPGIGGLHKNTCSRFAPWDKVAHNCTTPVKEFIAFSFYLL